MPRTVAIIQARMGSERLPGKVLKPVLGRPLLWYLLNQLKYSERLDEMVIATSDLRGDDVIEKFVRENDAEIFRGSEGDVLDRFHRAAAKFDAARIVRITADCPLICPTVVDATVENHLASGCDYTMNDVPKTHPRGYDVEVFSRDVLDRTHGAAKKSADREHVTRYIYTHSKRFSVNIFRAGRFPRFPTDRLCVDTREDYEVVRRVIENVYEEGSCMHHLRVLEYLKANPDVARLNSEVKQKTADGAGLE